MWCVSSTLCKYDILLYVSLGRESSEREILGAC